jgi:hypothetical protein
MLPPETVTEALLVTQRLAASWLRWEDVLKQKTPRNGTVNVSQLPPNIRRRFSALSTEASELHNALEKLLCG